MSSNLYEFYANKSNISISYIGAIKIRYLFATNEHEKETISIYMDDLGESS